MKKRVMLFLFTILIIFTLIFIPSFMIAGEKEELLDLINGERTSHGLSSLSFHSSLNTAAQLHSEDQIVNGYFSHTSLDGRTPWDRMQDAGFTGTSYGENIAAHTGTADASICFNSWMNSAPHYTNMMNTNFNFAGIGIASGNWSYSNFAGRYSTVCTLTLGKQNIVCVSGETRQCGVNNIGICALGSQTCFSGAWSNCDAVLPVIEICNNSLDDDCDGSVDEYCNCVSHNYSLCYSNDAYWYDSCDRKEDRKQDCLDGCLNGECIVCESHNSFSCYNNDAYWYDSCLKIQDKKEDCLYGCVNGLCNPAPCLDKDGDGFKDASCGGNDCNDTSKQINLNAVEICNSIDENCNDNIDEDCLENLLILNPSQDSFFNISRILVELNVQSLKGYVLYSLNGVNWYNFCSVQGICKNYLSLIQGTNNIRFKMADNFGKQYNSSLRIFIDSVKPVILSQEPRGGTYANGTFKVKYTEMNLKEVNLYLSEYGSVPVKVASRTDCLNGSNQQCWIEYDLSAYDGKQIKYYFEVKDNALKTVSSSYIAKVDKTASVISNFSLNKTSLIYNKYLMKMQVNERSNLFYSYPGKSLSSICSGCTSATKYFSFLIKPDYIDFTVKDLAGNSVVRRETL